ncbi:hypothetical protein E4634_07220 [Mangrovimicrobium sediminis]|uniref:Uncharacterized protein n=1 Tax=Mangrovimicrobium sediminis TaxID=2562682 RepID=A0A4Z0M3P5_9GAMM|nr:hypothetical protein [Haliea sp. SAOS-164]TGD73925.1 hypothetical protein E4634_07220 [Haliea sp. SAOS-164]
MYIKPRRPVLSRRSDRALVQAGLFFVCAMMSVLGLGVVALACFIPAAAMVEALSLVSPSNTSRRM